MRSGARLGLHPGLLSSALIAGTGIAAGAWLRTIASRAPPTVPPVLRAILPGVLALLFVSTSLEVARIAGTLANEPTARKAAVSIWWGVVAVGLIVAGFIWRTPASRHTGLALLAIATVKAAAFDLRDVPQLWRVVSFVGLGLLMLGVAVGYARTSSLLREPAERPGMKAEERVSQERE